jgi:hypothetical protein
MRIGGGGGSGVTAATASRICLSAAAGSAEPACLKVTTTLAPTEWQFFVRGTAHTIAQALRDPAKLADARLTRLQAVLTCGSDMGGDTERQRTPHMDMHRKSTNEEEIEGRHPQELFNTIEQMRNRPAIAND